MPSKPCCLRRFARFFSPTFNLIMPRSSARPHVLDPRLMVEIPTNRFPQSGFETILSFPPEFLFDLRRINGVTAIVAGTVRNKSNQAPGRAVGIGIGRH